MAFIRIGLSFSPIILPSCFNTEIISFTIGEIEYSDDSTEVELDYTITIKNIIGGDTDVETDDMEMIKTSEGDWIIIDM